MKINNILIVLATFVLVQCKSTSTLVHPEVEGYVLSNGSEIYYKTMGKGEPLVVIHGGPVLDHSYMRPWFDQLADDYQLIFYDQRANGKSSVDVDSTTMSLEGFANDIDNLRSHLGYERVNVLGHSWGGLIAMYYVTRYEDDVNTLILANSMPMDAASWREEQVFIASRMSDNDKKERENIMGVYMRDDPVMAVSKLLKLSFKHQFHDTLSVDKLILNIPSDYMARSQKMKYLFPDLTQYDLASELSEMKTPVLILYGDDEPSASHSANKLANTIPNAQLEIIPDCGHFPFIERPNDFFRRIEAFLKRK